MEERAMGNINVGRVIVGGLLAGLIINIGETFLNLLVVAQGMDHALKLRNLPPVGGGAIAGFVLLAFLLGGLPFRLGHPNPT